MSRDAEDRNRRLLRARDAMDRAYAEPLDVRAVASVAEGHRDGDRLTTLPLDPEGS